MSLSERVGAPSVYSDADESRTRAQLSPTRWRALHRAAAETLDPRSALTRRALAADRPDPELAAALEEAAVDGRAPDAEIDVPTRQLLVWAADLSGDRSERERRLLLAAMHSVYSAEVGDDDLWARIEALPPSPLRYCALAGRALREDRLAAAVYHLRAARTALAGAGPDAEPDASAVIETVEAFVACGMARGGTAVDAAGKALMAGSRDAVRVATARRLLLVGRAYIDGPREVLRALGDENAEDAADADAGVAASEPVASTTTRPPTRDAGLMVLRGECLVLAGDLEAGARDLEDVARSHGTQAGRPDLLRALEWLAITHFLLGNWQRADSFVDDIGAFGGDTAEQALRAMLMTVRGAGAAPGGSRRAPTYRGATANARASGTGSSSAHPDRLVMAAFADVVAMLSSRRHGDVLTTIDWLTSEAAGLEDAPAKFAPLLLPVYVEAAVEAGTRAVVEQGLARLRTLARQVPSLAVAEHRLAGRLAERRHDLIAAEREYEAGLLVAQTRAQVPPLHRAQLKFAYGRLLCVLGRTSAGLEWLQAAEDDFASLGALAYVRDCAQDRAGVIRGVPRGPDVALTEREVTVAGLVASGLTNRQVATELMISAKAVEYHLRKIYRKLGVSTRSELARGWPA